MSNLPKVNVKANKRNVSILFATIAVAILTTMALSLAIANLPVQNVVPDDGDKNMMAKDVAEGAARVMKSEPVEIVERTPINGKMAGGQIVYTAAYFRPTDRKFSNPPADLNGVGVKGNVDSTAADYNELGLYLRSSGFTKQIELKGQPGELIVQQSTYISERNVCHISHVDLTSTVVGAYLVGIGCASRASYEFVAEKLQPFYEAYAKANPKTSDDLYFDPPVFYEGANGARNASVGQVDSFSLFYQIPGMDWKYFKSTEYQPLCSEFKTDELKTAFAGRPCFDLLHDKSVKVKAP